MHFTIDLLCMVDLSGVTEISDAEVPLVEDSQ